MCPQWCVFQLSCKLAHISTITPTPYKSIFFLTKNTSIENQYINHLEEKLMNVLKIIFEICVLPNCFILYKSGNIDYLLKLILHTLFYFKLFCRHEADLTILG